MNPRFPALSSRRRGSVIVVVLITLLLASMMLTKFMESSAVELTLATRQADRERLRADCYAALETAIAVMAEIREIDNGLYAPAQGWDDPYGYAGESPREGVEITYEFIDESGKASLPNATFDDLVKFLVAQGMAEPDARRFCDGLFVWMREEHSPTDIEAEASRYERDLLAHEPPRRSLRSWEELRAIRIVRDFAFDEDGRWTAIGQTLRDSYSLYSFENANINALAPALGTARGWVDIQTSALAAYRQGRGPRAPGAMPWFTNMQQVATILGAQTDVSGIGAEASLIRVIVRAREGAATMSLETLVALADNVTFPEVAAGPSQNNLSTAAAATSGTTTNPAGQPAAGAAAGNRRALPGSSRRGLATGAARETGTGATSSEQVLNYPFRVLQVMEGSGPTPAALTEAEDVVATTTRPLS